MKLTQISVLLWPLALVLAALCSCASGREQAPPGGPADTTEPYIVSTVPANGSINVSDPLIEIEFNEYVQESGISEAVVITPLPAIPPDFGWSGRTLEIELQEPLIPNRTYAITLGGSITDLSGNRLGNPVTLRFSTGATIDSGIARGEVLGLNRRRAFIFAYTVPADAARFSDTLHLDSTRPDFIAPIGDDGRFSLEALPPGRFRLFAVADEYGDQLYTPGVDAFGVAPSDITIDSTYRPVTGISFRIRPAADDLTPPALYSARAVNRSTTELRFSEPIDTATIRTTSFSLSTTVGSVTIAEAWRSPANRLSVMLAHSELPAEAEVTVRATGLRDTVGNPLPDTLAVVTFTTGEDRDTIPPALLPLGLDTARASYTFPDSIPITFDEGVRVANAAAAVILRDTASARARFRLVRVSPAQLIAYPLDTLIGVQRGSIAIDLGQFTDASGNRRDSTALIPVGVSPLRQPGTLQGSIVDSAAPGASHVIIVRMVGTERVYRKTGVRNGAWEFTTIPEGEYEISAFRDSDNDGEYDFGSATPYQPAEAFVSWPSSVRVRPRWTVNKIDLVFPGGSGR